MTLQLKGFKYETETEAGFDRAVLGAFKLGILLGRSTPKGNSDVMMFGLRSQAG